MRVRLAVALSVCAATAHAHLRFPTVKAERWIEVRLDEAPIRIGYRIGYGVDLAKQQRKLADQDGDGEVVAAEGNAALDARTEQLIRHLSVCTGRSLDALECKALERRDVELVEAEGWVPGASGHLHFSWTLRLKSSASELGAIRIEDGWDVAGVEITDVRIEPPAERALTSAGEGGRPGAVAHGFNWIEARRGEGPRTIVATWPPSARTSWPLVVVGAALALAGGAAWAYSRRKSGSRAG